MKYAYSQFDASHMIQRSWNRSNKQYTDEVMECSKAHLEHSTGADENQVRIVLLCLDGECCLGGVGKTTNEEVSSVFQPSLFSSVHTVQLLVLVLWCVMVCMGCKTRNKRQKSITLSLY